MNYIENWFALGACIYSRKTVGAALSMLGLSHKPDKYSIGALLGIVEWDKVPVDTQIIVKTLFGERKLYFAGVGEKGFICCFPCGSTSWSHSENTMLWSYEEDDARLAENERD